LSLTRTEKKVNVAPTRSRAEWAASESTPKEPDISPAANFSSVMAAAASIECRDTRCFSAEKSAILEAFEFIDFLGDSQRMQPV